MQKVKAVVLRKFHVRTEPAVPGGKEGRRDYEPGEAIECTPEQFEVGKKAGLLGDPPNHEAEE